ncbi:hypothetical protein [[Clostridium] symbiosum]|uniref:hypothetical protein n=1 Tax=Clostridium symbiosum TaxID=1512 RepID=UPI001AA19A02|nr:hypothetical protein [[Clostridium] symbiosum]MBO1696574.1 hypothetical protein [[Clostridium] symbiosum]MDB2011392.1 hypothetical protein [[Clostridium] symbiosum]MDB2028975.1 hypothetical protein [[Clostridium] symbiosum]
MRKKFRMNLQLFAEPTGGAGGTEPPAGVQGQQTQPSSAGGQPPTVPQIDYTKIQQMLEGTLAAKEDTALKAYFKQQGLSQEEVEQAIATFKQQKAAQQPDVAALTQTAQAAQAAAQQAMLDKEATLAAISLGLDAKTIPYVLKMADLSQAIGQDGKVNTEALNTALNKVLEDVPALKPQASGTTGFVQVGAASTGQQTSNEPMTLKDAISAALKK